MPNDAGHFALGSLRQPCKENPCPPRASASPISKLSALWFSAGCSALLLSYLPVSLPVFLWPTLSQTLWGLTFQVPCQALLIFVYLFSAVSPVLLGCLFTCLLDSRLLPVSHPFFSLCECISLLRRWQPPASL